MPELPDLSVYLECLEARIQGQILERVRVVGPSLLRSFDPPIGAAAGKRVVALRRLGKRIVLGLEDDLFLVLHLMIAGRLRWRGRGSAPPRRNGLASFEFPTGVLVLTEASKKKRASLHLVRGEPALREHDPGGLEPLEADPSSFRAALLRENRTLKRALTDPRLFSGIGNAYGSPDKVTALRKGMAVHGRYREPCPTCSSPVQRIVYAENEVNYCATCQTGGRLLADRALSRLLKEDWPRSLAELEERRGGAGRSDAG